MKLNRIAIGVLACLLSIWISQLAFGSSQTTSSTTASAMIDKVEARLNDTSNKMWLAGDLLSWLNEGMLDIVIRTHCLEATETIFLDTNTLEYSITSTYITVKAVHYIDASHKTWALKKGSPLSVGQAGEDQGGGDDSTVPMYWYDWDESVGIYPALTALENSGDTIVVNGAVTNGGLIQITTGTAHGYSTGDTVTIAGVGGTTEANGDWTITVISTTEFDLIGSTFANSYSSPGTVFETETVKIYYITRPTDIIASATITTPAIYDNLLIIYIMGQAYLRDNQLNRFLQTMALYEREVVRLRGDLVEFSPQVID
jgi:hypothetical protein